MPPIVMTNCPACGSADIHRSRAASAGERARKLFSDSRPHRCHACGWRGWGPPSRRRHLVAATADGWQAVDVDLEQLDARSATLADQRAAQLAADPAATAPERRRGRRQRPLARGTERERDFNRGVQLVLFLTLLLAGFAVMTRACGG